MALQAMGLWGSQDNKRSSHPVRPVNNQDAEGKVTFKTHQSLGP